MSERINKNKNKNSVCNTKEDLSDIKDFVNEGGNDSAVPPDKKQAGNSKEAKPRIERHDGRPLSVDPTDLTTAKQFDEARSTSHRH